MIEADLFSHLRDNVPSSNGRVYPQVLPVDHVVPAVVYTIVNDLDKTSVNLGRYGSKVRIQLDCYATTYLEVKQLKDEVKTALYDFEHTPHSLSSRDMPEDSKLYRQLIEFYISI